MSTLMVNGEQIDIPALDDYDLDELGVLYERTGLTVAELDETTYTRPAVMKTMVVIAIQRVHPDVATDEIEEAIGKVKWSELVAALGDDEGDASPPPQDASGKPSSFGNGSGDNGMTSSAPLLVRNGPVSTGTPASATSESPSPT